MAKKKMTRKLRQLVFFICIFSLCVGGILLWLWRHNTSKEEVEKRVAALLPQGAFLRDMEKVPGKNDTFLLLYAEKGFTYPDGDFETCTGSVLGKPIQGIYHIALIENGRQVNDIVIPSPGFFAPEKGNNTLELVYFNTKANIYKKGEYAEEEVSQVEQVKLLHLRDLTGDGKPYEFLITTTGGGCGFHEGLVAGYDEVANKVRLFSDWIFRFAPNAQGMFEYTFECGDHGNDVRREKRFAYDKVSGRFQEVWNQETPCRGS